MTTYLGTDLLLIRPNSLTAFPSDASRPLHRAEIDTGNVLTQTTAALSATTHELEWALETRAQLTALRAVLDARLGQTVPLWIPSYLHDIDVLAEDTFWWKVPTARGGATFGARLTASAAWQHWFQSAPGGSLYRIRQFTSATDDLDGTTKWNGFPNTGTDGFLTSANGRVFSRLMFCRMASDSYRIRSFGKASLVNASFVEVPAETPS